MIKPLEKSDIVGETIRQVWEKPDPLMNVDVVAVRVFVELSQGQLLELTYNDLGDGVGNLAWADISRDMLQVATVVDWGADWRGVIIGARIIEVICSPYWASYGLLCSSGYTLCIGPDSTHVRRMGAIIDRPNFKDDPDDYITGFEERPVALCPELSAWHNPL